MQIERDPAYLRGHNPKIGPSCRDFGRNAHDVLASFAAGPQRTGRGNVLVDERDRERRPPCPVGRIDRPDKIDLPSAG